MKKKTHEKFVEDVYNIYKTEYEIIGKYTNSKTKIKLRHNNLSCNNNEFEMKPNNFLDLKQRCPKCFGNQRKAIEDFKKQVFDLVGNEYEVIGDYKNTMTKIKLLHNNLLCNNNEFKMSPSNFLQGQRCPKCFGNKKKTTKQFKKEVYDLCKNEYIVLGEYLNARTKIEILHTNCNKSYLVTPNKFLSNRRCPFCKESKGEKRIEEFLIDKKILYKRQYKFDDCKYIRSLPFDFAIFREDKSLNFLIEYDGEQHFKQVLFHESNIEKKISLYETKKRDQIKTDYCTNNNIKLVRIPYWEYKNINSILKKEI